MSKVYFVGAPGRIKIGFTRHPERRLIALRRADMEELTVIAIIDGNRTLEKKLHGLLTEHRFRGEWFRDCEDVRRVITDAIAGKHAIVEEPKADPVAETVPYIEPPPTPEFQIVARLFDEAEAALDRNADKYEVRGRVQAALIAAEMLIKQRNWNMADR